MGIQTKLTELQAMLQRRIKAVELTLGSKSYDELEACRPEELATLYKGEEAALAKQILEWAANSDTLPYPEFATLGPVSKTRALAVNVGGSATSAPELKQAIADFAQATLLASGRRCGLRWSRSRQPGRPMRSWRRQGRPQRSWS